MPKFLSHRILKYGSNALVAVLITVGILAVVNFLTTRYHARFDLTARGLYTLSPQTISLLENLSEDVNVVAFFREAEQRDYEHLLKQYAYHSRRFAYRFVDPDREPIEARRYTVTRYGVSVIEYGNREERIRETSEKVLTNGIARLMSEERQVVYFVGGHDEAHPDDQSEQGFSGIKQLLIEGNHDVRPSLVLAQSQRVPKDCDALIVAGPKRPFLPAEIDIVATYLNQGGAAFFLLDPLIDTGLVSLLRKWSIGLRNDFVVDKSQVLPGADFSVPVTTHYSKHPITDKHSGLQTFYPLTRSMERVGSLPGADVSSLVLSSPNSWSETNLDAVSAKDKEAVQYTSGADRPGPLWLAMVVEGPTTIAAKAGDDRRGARARIVVFGDSDFASNRFVEVAGNGDLFMNAANWLLRARDKITIRPKSTLFRPLTLNPGDEFWIRWVYWLVLPGVPIVAGVLVWWRRR